jgi:ATP-binding protein involved in chromosome partitioning
MSAIPEDVSRVLSQVSDPVTGKNLLELGAVTRAEKVGQGRVEVDLAVPEATYRERVGLTTKLEQMLSRLPGVGEVGCRVRLDPGSRPIPAEDPVPHTKNVILVMSGKGGVGKSTVAVNLAVGLARTGARVGLLDADLYGPSIPTMMGVHGQLMGDGDKILPIEHLGVRMISMGFLLEDPHTAVVWRGPMLHSALLQFLGDVAWGTLDYLLLDLPPGTGDVAITLSQEVKSTGAVIVTTPQQVAVDDVFRAVAMCQKVGVTLLGVVENQSYFVCEHGTRYELFGSGGGRAVAEMARAPLLGQIPIDPAVCRGGDAGTPVTEADPLAPIAGAFSEVLESLVSSIARENTRTAQEMARSGGATAARRLPVVR